MARVRPRAIFMDDGGVIGDNLLRGPQWGRLVAEFFAPRLGGERSDWREANVNVFKSLLPYLMNGPDEGPFMEYWNEYQRRWLRGMSAAVGVEAPVDDDECAELANASNVFITRRVVAELPGAAEAVRQLRSMGLDLYTASGGLSWQLDGYFKALGIRDCFIELYGPDLVDRAKYGPTDGTIFYKRVFEHAGVAPQDALVIDDSPMALSWARKTGAMTCLVSGDPSGAGDADLVVGMLAELPGVLNADDL